MRTSVSMAFVLLIGCSGGRGSKLPMEWGGLRRDGICKGGPSLSLGVFLGPAQAFR